MVKKTMVICHVVVDFAVKLNIKLWLIPFIR